MSLINLDKIFNPRRIALIGASVNPNSVSGKTLSNLTSGGYRGVVYPVNPAEEAVSGIPCFSDLAALPNKADMAIICTAAKEVPDHVHQCGLAGIQGIIIMSAGFREAGPEGKALEDRIREEKERFPGMRILGPNCLGVIVPSVRMNASFASVMPAPGNIAFISQSGALCTSVLDWAMEGKTGFSYFVSLGNSLDIDFGDLIDYFGQDDSTRSIMLYIESVGQARKFMTAARTFARSKPIIVYKSGRFAESAEAAASHTGAMASEDAVYDAAFQRTGMARVYDIGDIFDVAAMIGRNRFPRGARLGIVTNAGGPGVMATDTLIAMHGELARLSDDTLTMLNENLPAFWSHGNPVDVLGDARAKRVAKAVSIVLQDQGVDAVLVILTPQAMTNPLATAKEVGALAGSAGKPILAAWIGGKSMREGIQILTDAGVAAYQTPEQAIRAFMTLTSYARNLGILYETPRDIPLEFNIDREKAKAEFLRDWSTEGEILSEESSKRFLEAYGIPVTLPRIAHSAEEAVALSTVTTYPVVMKIHAPDITHKSDVGGVMLNLADEKMVRHAWDHMMYKVKTLMPGARIEGVSIQKMASSKEGLELIVGIKKDPVFGTVIMAGMGGTAAELYADRALGFPPLNERLARLMLESLRIYPLITGYRGASHKSPDKLIEVLIRISYLAADYPEIKELDINPLLISPEQVLALDARIVLDSQHVQTPMASFSHLALHPYPEKYVREFNLKDGSSILFRPIKPEDEPMWFELLRSCSAESLYSRFRYFFHWETHEVASRYCYIDYDREIAIVAEVTENDRKKLVGVGRLVADPDHEEVEYAILIADAWQNRDLGHHLTGYCLEIAGKWKLKRMVAQTTTDNSRMIALFRKHQFEMQTEDETVFVSKALDDTGN
ncbi:MAG TPA: bifunctional acetate--CoA ligase family protein/GNAT family N-acetyltransferase [Bacteroidales bacterium]|nr:bifunctional acetate--CoA ligase family protein/GNAT family N-acetyltransferase [Bacteroidales bacterium]HSA42091.1 bifunctional acetate--CoA ligase family protein/GNAT family N-acetyltransferase [Bacteroidales bacterium]